MLYFVPTPIGNLDDISYRTVAVLLETNLYLCEDTRVTKKLLTLLSDRLNIDFKISSKEFISLHSHNEAKFVEQSTKEYFENKTISYVSDAGMPCVSDPGALLVDFCIKNNIKYDVLPGANALLTAYAMSGYNKKEFTFFGFLVHKGKQRTQELQSVLSSKYVTILYESPHRLLKLLEELNGQAPNRVIFLTKELTKKYQRYIFGTAQEILDKLEGNFRGEWVAVIEASVSQNISAISQNDILALDLPKKDKAKLICKITGENTKACYERLFKLV